MDDEQIAAEVAVALSKVWDAYVAEWLMPRDQLEQLLENKGFWRFFGRDPAKPPRVRCYFGQVDPSIPSDIATHPEDHVVVRYVD